MSFAFLPLYTGDYRRDTQDLTLTEHGIYLLLLMHCWDTRSPVPPDETRAARIVGASSDDERNAVKSILLRYFVRHEDGWYNPRMEREVSRANVVSSARSEAGRKGASRTWGKREASAEASAMAIAKASAMASDTTPTPTPTSTPTTTEKRESEVAHAPRAHPKNGSTRATRLPEGWQLPPEWQQWAVDAFHAEPQKVFRVGLDFRDYWHAKPGRDGVKLDWLATWRRWCRREFENA